MNVPEAKLGCVANLFVRQMYFKKAGDVEQGHTHSFDHLSLLASGSIKIIVDGVASEFVAPHMIYIKADKMHEITALEDNTAVYCVHALRDKDGDNDILDPSMIPKGVNISSIALPICN